MKSRPKSVAILGWLFIGVGAVSFANHFRAFTLAAGDARQVRDLVIASASAIVAIASGTGILRGRNWARWMCAAWMGFHLVLSMVHSLEKLLMHAVLFAPLLFLLFRAPARDYFLGAPAERELRSR